MANPPSPAFAPATDSASDLLFRDLDQEMMLTRRMLASVPDGHTDWRPHEKSTTLGRLATHLAELAGFAHTIASTDDLDFSAAATKQHTLSTTAEILALFDERVATMKETIKGMDWDALNAIWTGRIGQQVFIHDRKGALLRMVGISHMIHHRAQLGVYLRLLNVPVPSIYGPTADSM